MQPQRGKTRTGDPALAYPARLRLIPKASSPATAENIDVFDFELTGEE